MTMTKVRIIDDWCRAVKAACAKVGVPMDISINGNTGKYEIDTYWADGLDWDEDHRKWHVVHRALQLCEPLRTNCPPSPALALLLAGERPCGHVDCPHWPHWVPPTIC